MIGKFAHKTLKLYLNYKLNYISLKLKTCMHVYTYKTPLQMQSSHKNTKDVCKYSCDIIDLKLLFLEL